MEVITLSMEESQAGQRLDKVLSSSIEGSRTQIQQWIKDGNVKVNESKAKGNYKVKVNDTIVIEIPEPEPLDVVAEEMDLYIYY